MLDASNGERGAQAFSLRLPRDLAKALREQAQAHERSQGGEVRHILRVHLEKRRGALVVTVAEAHRALTEAEQKVRDAEQAVDHARNQLDEGPRPLAAHDTAAEPRRRWSQSAAVGFRWSSRPWREHGRAAA